MISVPNAPDASSLSTVEVTDKITIQPSSSNVTATSGLLDKYYIQALTPNDGMNVNSEANKTDDLELINLVGGTEYLISVGSMIEACGGVSSSETTILTKCTGNVFQSSTKTTFYMHQIRAAHYF